MNTPFRVRDLTPESVPDVIITADIQVGGVSKGNHAIVPIGTEITFNFTTVPAIDYPNLLLISVVNRNGELVDQIPCNGITAGVANGTRVFGEVGDYMITPQGINYHNTLGQVLGLADNEAIVVRAYKENV